MLQRQQHRYQRCTYHRLKVWFLESKRPQSVDSKQQDKQHYGHRSTVKTGHHTKRQKNSGKKIYSTRLGRSKNHIAKSIFKKQYTPSQHKGGRDPWQLLEKEENQLQKNIEDKQIKKLHKCSAELFIYTVVIAVSKDKTVKIALDSKKLNDAIHKNKFQMQNIGNLIDSVAVNISKKNIAGQFLFSKIDLKHA